MEAHHRRHGRKNHIDRDVLTIGKELEKLVSQGTTALNEDRAVNLLQTVKGMKITSEALTVSN
jgi:hypothetical protein